MRKATTALAALGAVAVVYAGVRAVPLARAWGRKAPEPPAAVEPAAVQPAAVEAQAPAAPADARPATPAPKLFGSGLPVDIGARVEGVASMSAAACGACHYAAHDAWSGSRHAAAWQSATFQAALRGAGKSTACLGCHLPVASQHAELAAGYVDGDLSRPNLVANPSFDLSLMGEGVSCAACHVREGVVIGLHASGNAPHATVASDELASPELCATCHQLTWPGADRPYYDTYGEWEASPFSAAGVRCQDCHMAPTTGAALPGSRGSVPSHGGVADLARALTTQLDAASDVVRRGQPYAVTLAIMNTGAGHAVPTGNPANVLEVTLALVDAKGKDLDKPKKVGFSRTVEAQPPYRQLADTRIAAGGSVSIEHAFTASAKASAGEAFVEVRAAEKGRTVVLRRVRVELR